MQKEILLSMELTLLQDILVLLSFSVLIVFLLQRLKLPSILGFLITGIIIGPYGLSLINAVEQVETISEIGVILLLFVIGMEMSIKQLAAIKKTVFVGGFLQIVLTVGLTAIIYHFFGVSWSQAVFIGFLCSLSSTAIVLKVLQDRNEISEQHGRNALAILIFQDIIVVPMMLITPIMAGNSTNVTQSIIELLVKSLIVVVITVVLARYVVPKFMYLIAKTRSKELFLLATITICMAVAYLTSMAGLSLALGAFLAGLIISESEYSHQATSIILPFRELFTSFFFISIGMLLNINFFVHHLSVVLGLVAILFIVKGGATAIAVAVLRYPPKTVLLTAFSLFQIGEFAFILSKIGIQNGLMSDQVYQYFLAIAICSMLVTPFVIMYASQISDLFLHSGFASLLRKRRTAAQYNLDIEGDTELEHHLIIVGYGVNGKSLAKAAEFSGIPYVILEVNAETVRRERKNGVPILFGDASQEHILNHVNLYHARVIAIAVPKFETSKAIIQSIRSISKSVHLVVRTRFVSEIHELRDLGANEVIPEELETSVEIFSRILHNFMVPEDEIVHFIENIRADNYQLFQEKEKLPRTFKLKEIPDFNITALRVLKDSGWPVGKSLKELDLRSKCGVNVVAISRKGDMLASIAAEDVIKQNDLLFVQGEIGKIEDFRKSIGS